MTFYLVPKHILTFFTGEQDAYVNVGTFAITTYLDMGVTILMLWYGGLVAMDEPGVLTVGKLITFQLYW